MLEEALCVCKASFYIPIARMCGGTLVNMFIMHVSAKDVFFMRTYMGY